MRALAKSTPKPLPQTGNCSVSSPEQKADLGTVTVTVTHGWLNAYVIDPPYIRQPEGQQSSVEAVESKGQISRNQTSRTRGVAEQGGSGPVQASVLGCRVDAATGLNGAWRPLGNNKIRQRHLWRNPNKTKRPRRIGNCFWGNLKIL